jgi:hypothetical protein
VFAGSTSLPGLGSSDRESAEDSELRRATVRQMIVFTVVILVRHVWESTIVKEDQEKC